MFTESERKACKALIADDVLLMRELLKAILRKLGFSQFHEAENGEDAIRRYEEIKPEILFIDIDMPVKDGWHALTMIRQLDPRVLIVMVSGHDYPEDMQRAAQMGANAYIVKPFSVVNVKDAIDQLVRNDSD